MDIPTRYHWWLSLILYDIGTIYINIYWYMVSSLYPKSGLPCDYFGFRCSVYIKEVEMFNICAV